MDVTIELFKEEHKKELYLFECENRFFFETLVPSRGDYYYQFDSFQKACNDLLVEQDEGKSLFYLIKNEIGQIVGRINVVDIDSGSHSAHIGYRIGETFLKCGIASRAVQLIQEEAIKRNISKLCAKTTSNNVGSQKVLEKNYFVRVSSADNEVFLMNGEELTFVHYCWECTF